MTNFFFWRWRWQRSSLCISLARRWSSVTNRVRYCSQRGWTEATLKCCCCWKAISKGTRRWMAWVYIPEPPRGCDRMWKWVNELAPRPPMWSVPASRRKRDVDVYKLWIVSRGKKPRSDRPAIKSSTVVSVKNTGMENEHLSDEYGERTLTDRYWYFTYP